ncbi:MAG: hypothetical protein ACUVWP_06920 [bacterium]
MFIRYLLKYVILSVVFYSLIIISVCGEERPLEPYNTELYFYQINFDLDGRIKTDSSYGLVNLNFDRTTDILYFNLVVNDNWIVENIPILSFELAGDRQSRFIMFDLGIEDGNNVDKLDYAYSLTKETISERPDNIKSKQVGDYEVIFYSGLFDEPFNLFKIGVVMGGAVSSYLLQDENFPNQESGKKECVPTAVSNSLRYLNSKFNLGLTDDQVSIAKMKYATRWNGGCSSDWWRYKKDFMEVNNYPINTERMGGDYSTMFDRAGEALEDGKDVELCFDKHCVAVIGITKTGDTTYSVDIVHDIQQGRDGGTVIETVTFDYNTGKFTSGVVSNGQKFGYFIVESKK